MTRTSRRSDSAATSRFGAACCGRRTISSRDAHVSLLSQGGAIDTQQFAVEIAGAIVNAGILAKRGLGTLTLSGNSAHQGTHVSRARSPCSATTRAACGCGRGATLAGTGTVGSVDASLGTISPGVNGPGELHAGDVQMSPSHALAIELNGVKPGSQHDRLVATGSVSLNGANLALVPGGPMPAGATFTIVTHANGTFAGLPDGAIIVTAFGKFRIPTPEVRRRPTSS